MAGIVSHLDYPRPQNAMPSSDIKVRFPKPSATAKASGSSSHSEESPSQHETTPEQPTIEELQKAAGAPGAVGIEPIPTKSLLIKTKKPRPYVCPTCTRSFVRLEHLKRHERSHTKEKPFQCPICERSFARRDLLLRHKQKLHASFSPGDNQNQGGSDGRRKLSANSEQYQLRQQSQPQPSNQPPNQPQHQNQPPNQHQPPNQLPDQSPNQPQHQHQHPQQPQQAQTHPLPQPQQKPKLPHHPLQNGDILQAQVDAGAGNLESALPTPSHSISPSNNTEFPSYASKPSIKDVPQQPLSNQPYDNQPWDGDPSSSELSKSAEQMVRLEGISEWMQLNSASQNFDMFTLMAPPLRMSARSSRASSFSAASATSYVRRKDIESTQRVNGGFNPGASEVGFATPQAYAVDDTPYDFEALDLNYVTPSQLTHPPPSKRRASFVRRDSTRGSSTGQGGAVQALRNQVHLQRQLYTQYGVVSSPSDPLRRPDGQLPQPNQLQPNQVQNQSQLQATASQNQPLQQPLQPQSQQQQQQQNQQYQPQQFVGGLSIESLLTPQEFSDSLYSGYQNPDMASPNQFTPLAYSSVLTPSGITPGLTPGMGVPYQSSTLSQTEETEIQDFLAKQGDDFVNSLFDADEEPVPLPVAVAEPMPLSVVPGSEPGLATDPFNRGSQPDHALSASGRASVVSNRSDSGSYGSDLQRFVDAYFSGFDKHLSFVHRVVHLSFASPTPLASESPGFSPPSSSNSVTAGHSEVRSSPSVILAQAQAAVGAQTLGERGAAQAYYWAARDHGNGDDATPLELFQTDLLVAIWGIFSDDPHEHASAINKLSQLGQQAESVLCKDTQCASKIKEEQFELDWLAGAETLWEQFIVTQEKVRTLHALHSVCTWIRQVPSNLLDLLKSCGSAPCNDDLWRAPNSDQWLRILASRGLDASVVAETGGGSPNEFASSLDQLIVGQIPAEDVSQFTLQSLLLALQSFITNEDPQAERASLRSWETMWARFPEASLDPNPIAGPIMSDCVGIVSLTAFGHLDLAPMLDSLWKHDFEGVSRNISRAVYHQAGLFSIANYAVDTLVWCEGHVTSQSIFFTTILAVAECGLVLADALRAIAAKTTPLSSNEDQLIQRSRRLVRNVLRVQSVENINELPNGVLRSAACLVRLSDWPLVSVLSRSLLAHIVNR